MSRRVQGEGPIPCEIMLVGERPGEQEVKQGRPFVGKTGLELNRFLKSGGLSRSDVYITNLVKDYRNGENPAEWEVERDWDELQAELCSVAPRVIVPMGRWAARALLGDVDMEMVHGIPFPYNHSPGVIVFPIYHPAAGFYNADIQPHIQNDFTRLGLLSRGELAQPVDYFGLEAVDYRELTTPDQVDECLPLDAPYIAIDTEGIPGQPWCLTFSVVPGTAYMVRPNLHDGIIFYFAARLEMALSSGCRVLLHNSLHDLAVLRDMGIEIPDSSFTDTMVLAYLLCLEPQGLKPLAFRHAGMEMHSYDELMGPASREMAIEYLTGIGAVDWPRPEPYTIIKGGIPKVCHPYDLGRRIKRILGDIDAGKVDKSGNPVDPRKRWHGIEPYVKQDAVALLGDMPEATLDLVPLERAKRYACRDADATLRIHPCLAERIEAMELGQVSEIDHNVLPILDRMQHVGFPVGKQELWDRLVEKCEGIMNRERYQIYKLTGAQINPDSGDQVAELLFDQLKLKIRKLTESGDRGSTNDKVLEAMVGEHPCVRNITTYREASKVRNSFAIPIPVRERDGRIHCRIRATRVSSGRLAATEPNLLAIPVRTELGREVRSCFVAREGRILSSHDFDQAEMRVMAHESEDPTMIEVLSDPRRDIHSETAMDMFGIKTSWKDKYAGVDNMYHRYPAKRVGFGVITGITGIGLKAQMDLAGAKNPKTGNEWTEDECDALIIAWFRVYPGARNYMDRKRAEARRYGFVRDMWGRIRYLPGVHSPNQWIAEEALRQSHSHAIQAGAQGIIKIAMANIWPSLKAWRETRRYAECLLQIHDELIHEWDDDPQFIKEADSVVVWNMENAVKLKVPMRASGHFDHDWGKLKD